MRSRVPDTWVARLWVILVWAGVLTLLLAARGGVESLAGLLESGGVKRRHWVTVATTGAADQLGRQRARSGTLFRSGPTGPV